MVAIGCARSYGDASCETKVTEVRDDFAACETEVPAALMDAHYDENICPRALAYEPLDPAEVFPLLERTIRK